MTTRRLVQLDADGWSLEIDKVKLVRVAREFKVWLDSLDPQDDPFGFLASDLPLVEAALADSLPLPYKGPTPHSYEIREGLLDDYLEIAAPFYNTIRGADRSPETVERDGKRFAWVEFE